MLSWTSVVLLVVCYSTMTSLAMQSGKYSVMTNSTTNAQVCSTDSPSQVLPMCPGGGEAQCGIHCMMSSCPYYQFKSKTPIQCELYKQFPWNFTSIANCIGYSLYDFPSECSFPVTLNGQLYNGCIPNGANGACFSVNRTTTSQCKTNPVTGMVNDTLRIGNQSVPVQSILSWVIWMKRTLSVSYNWQLPWASYKSGFGSVGDGNYWLGLERVSQLTSSSQYRLRIEMKEQSTGAWYSVEYWSFKVGDETSTQYQLNVDGFSGDAGNGFQYTGIANSIEYANGWRFSTNDKDLYNPWCRCNTAARLGGGFWYSNKAGHASLTGNPNLSFFWAVPPPINADIVLSDARMMIKLQ